MSDETAVAAPQAQFDLMTSVATRYGMERDDCHNALAATILGNKQATKAQVNAFLVVAYHHNLNPFLKEIYAFPAGAGIVPIVSIDGWLKLMNSHPAMDGIELEDLEDPDGNIMACKATIWRKDREHPVSVTETIKENDTGSPQWKKRPRRMIHHRASIQAARLAFSFAGIYDEEEGREAARVVDAEPVDAAARAQVEALNARIEEPSPNESALPARTEEPHVALAADMEQELERRESSPPENADKLFEE